VSYVQKDKGMGGYHLLAKFKGLNCLLCSNMEPLYNVLIRLGVLGIFYQTNTVASIK
jgi:hypothetical protein